MSKKTSRVAASFCAVAIAGGGAGAAAVAFTHDSSSKTVTVAAPASGASNVAAGSALTVGQIAKESSPGVVEIDATSTDAGLPVPGQRWLELVRRGNRVRLRPEGRHRHERPRRRRCELDLGQVPGRFDVQGDRRRGRSFERPGGHPRQRAGVEADGSAARRLRARSPSVTASSRSATRSVSTTRSRPASSARSTVRSPRPTSRRSRARSRRTPRSTMATPAARSSTSPAR